MKPFEISADFAERFAADPSSFKFLRASQNLVYEFTDANGMASILRLTPESHRSIPQIQEELHWIKFLGDGQVSVCSPLAIAGLPMIQTIRGPEEAFHAVTFQRAPGRPIEKSDLSPDLYRRHGRQMAVLHDRAKHFPQDGMTHRTKWDEERYFTADIQRYLPEHAREPVLRRFEVLRRKFNAVPVTKETFGPVHFDLGYSNFFIDDKHLWLFDFDNSTLSYFVGDIAAALYSSVFIYLRRNAPGDRTAFESAQTGWTLEEVWQPFREGYEEINTWGEEWDEQLPLWIEVMFLRAVAHAFRMLHPITDPKTAALLDADIQNFIAGTMPLHFDFRDGKALA